MKASTFLVAATLLSLGLLAAPVGDFSPAGTASAYVCNLDDAVDGAQCLVEQNVSCARSMIKGNGCPR